MCTGCLYLARDLSMHREYSPFIQILCFFYTGSQWTASDKNNPDTGIKNTSMDQDNGQSGNYHSLCKFWVWNDIIFLPWLDWEPFTLSMDALGASTTRGQYVYTFLWLPGNVWLSFISMGLIWSWKSQVLDVTGQKCLDLKNIMSS